MDKKKRAQLKKYVFAVSSSFFVLLITYIIRSIIGSDIPFFFAIVAVCASSWFGGKYAGIAATGILFLGNIFILHMFGTEFSFVPFLLSFSFLVEGLFVSYVIEKVTRTEMVKEYQEREEAYITELKKEREALKRAEEEVRARDEFLSIASHELKTPLTSMLLQLQTSLHNIRNVSLANFSVEKLLKMLESTESQSKRLAKMINDLLNVSLITTGKLELELERADLSEIVASVVESFADRAKRENTSIAFFPNGEIVGMWDKIRIEQALSNLLSNALKYGNKKPIEVTVEKDENLAAITVHDNGIGMSPKVQEKIFNRFSRGVSAHEYEGLGVGLYITSQIIAAHHGKILVKSREGHGTTFRIELPAVHPDST